MAAPLLLCIPQRIVYIIYQYKIHLKLNLFHFVYDSSYSFKACLIGLPALNTGAKILLKTLCTSIYYWFEYSCFSPQPCLLQVQLQSVSPLSVRYTLVHNPVRSDMKRLLTVRGEALPEQT